jgi:hypothetical protein
MEQLNCLSRTPFFHFIFVVLSGFGIAFPRLAFGLLVNNALARSHPPKKISAHTGMQEMLQSLPHSDLINNIQNCLHQNDEYEKN